MLPDILRWAALAAITAAVLRLPRPLGFWSHDVGRPLVLARVRPDGPAVPADRRLTLADA